MAEKSNETIYLTVALHVKEGADVLGIIDEMDYFFEHSDIESTEIQEVLTEDQVRGETMGELDEKERDYFKLGRFQVEAFREAAQILESGWEAAGGIIVPMLLFVIGMAFIFEQRRQLQTIKGEGLEK